MRNHHKKAVSKNLVENRLMWMVYREFQHPKCPILYFCPVKQVLYIEGYEYIILVRTLLYSDLQIHQKRTFSISTQPIWFFESSPHGNWPLAPMRSSPMCWPWSSHAGLTPPPLPKKIAKILMNLLEMLKWKMVIVVIRIMSIIISFWNVLMCFVRLSMAFWWNPTRWSHLARAPEHPKPSIHHREWPAFETLPKKLGNDPMRTDLPW